MRKLHGAFVGFGKVVAEGHVPGYRSAKGFEMVAVVDPAPESRALAEEMLPGVRTYADLAALAAAEEKLQFVDVATPPNVHAATSIDALERGFHVLCEKPLATTAAEVADLRRAARRSSRTLFTVHNWKYAPIFRRLHGLLRAGTIGDASAIEWNVLRPDPPQDVAEAGWRLDPSLAGGGILMDHGWHAFYLMMFLTGRDPRSVTATTRSERGLPVEDTADCTIDFDGCTARIHLEWGGSERRTYGTVVGPLGRITVDDDRLVVMAGDRPPAETRFAPPLSASSYHPEWFPALLGDFRTEVLHATERGRNLAEAVRVSELMVAAYASRGEPVSLVPPPEAEVADEPGPGAIEDQE